MDEYLRSNQKLWNDWTDIHEKSAFYDVESFKAGKFRLDSIEKEELGDVRGKSLLHLQCHFGIDTLSWANLGAIVTGVDFSDKAIALARSLSEEMKIPATFVHSNVYDLPKNLSGQFDIVFTSYGVLGWLPDIEAWAKVVAHFLKPGGTFFVVEIHPTAWMFDEEGGELKVKYSYFPTPEPLKFDVKGSYADPEHEYRGVEYGWSHSLSEYINSLIGAGLRIESFKEYPHLLWKAFPFMEKGEDGWWRLTGQKGEIPLMFSIKATKPE
ncbi:MAG TPA: class I SAM-dependent methyltransferase [Chloroflexia bacterium]|nr:class I SAM-dependent methyltransferase [Chloroflexia bacterium]